MRAAEVERLDALLREAGACMDARDWVRDFLTLLPRAEATLEHLWLALPMDRWRCWLDGVLREPRLGRYGVCWCMRPPDEALPEVIAAISRELAA